MEDFARQPNHLRNDVDGRVDVGKEWLAAKNVGEDVVSIFQLEKREEKQQIDGIPIYEYRSNTMPILGVH